jgi:hypothetical protein
MFNEFNSALRNPNFKKDVTRSIQKKDKLPSNIDDRPMQPAMLLLHAGGGNPTHSS